MLLVDHADQAGKKILTAEVGGWYDCGKLDTLLESNEILLNKGHARRRDFPGVTIHDPARTFAGYTLYTAAGEASIVFGRPSDARPSFAASAVATVPATRS